jgi:hypothetical protein
MTLETLLQSIDSDLSSGKLIKPETWLDRSFYLSGFLEEEQIKEAQLEVELAKVIERESVGEGGRVNMTQAENRAKKDPKWLEWKSQQAKVRKIENYITAAKRHASRMY